MNCKELQKLLSQYSVCSQEEDGLRYVTQCLYPSAAPVEVFIHPRVSGFRVHDGGGAVRSSWDHARDERLAKRMIARQAEKYQIGLLDGESTLYVDVESVEWLYAAILAVANASAGAAHTTFERIAAANETALKGRIESVLSKIVPAPFIKPEYVQVGKSGKEHRFDFAIASNKSEESIVLIDAVAPHPISVAARYVAFSDTLEAGRKFAVHDRPLASSDSQLLLQVADLVPFKSLKGAFERQLFSR